jgi:sterol desaturase/sphingolipid hydroxylase (fatty acid hydroxylase superfamily)
LALFIFYFIFDFFCCWWHRLQHAAPILWVTHELHHVDQNMGVTTTMKARPVSVLGRTVFVAIPMAVFFKLEPITVFWVGYSARLFQHFVYMNISCHLGWFSRIIASPKLHRVHHSTLAEHRDKNLAPYFPILDVVFGTYYPPGKVAPPTGVHSGETCTSLWLASMQPFADWWNMARGHINHRRSILNNDAEE